MTPYYASLNTDIARLSVETVETKALENAIAGQGYIQSYAQNGNPPATSSSVVFSGELTRLDIGVLAKSGRSSGFFDFKTGNTSSQ